MRTKIIGTLVGCCLTLSLCGQSDPRTNYTNFPLVLSIQFHAFTLPFRDIKSNFSHVGFGIGTEVSFNGKQNWVQQISAVWYRNKELGNGLLFYTQTVWRPGMGADGFVEAKAGVGYLYSFRPVESFKQENGNWMSAGHRGKGMLTLPVGVSVGYTAHAFNRYVAPFVGYQFLIVSGYNKSIPVVPETLVQIGTRVH
jgi:hypothetical protein